MPPNHCLFLTWIHWIFGIHWVFTSNESRTSKKSKSKKEGLKVALSYKYTHIDRLMCHRLNEINSSQC
jgi:hypothetical protein